jgi:cytochrome P450
VSMTELYWDPITPELRDDPYPLWKRMRDEAPVYYNDRFDFYALSRFHDIEAAHRDHATYSSNHGTTLETMSPDPVDTGMIIYLDPPKHTMLRKLVSRAFTPRRVSVLEDRIRQVCARLLDPHVGSGRFDYVQEFTAILPPTVISSLLGVPDGEQEELRQIVDDVFHIEEGVGMANETSFKALAALGERLGAHFAERRTDPRDDVFTDLVEAEIEDENGEVRRLTDDELSGFGVLLFSAGSETVARHLGWAAKVLDEYPDQRAELAADSSLVTNAVEELLRYEPPSPVQARWTTRDVTVEGVTIPRDSRVIFVTGSAGHDERKYPNPDVLDIHRNVDLHMTFGYGIHFCLGAALARMEGRIGIEETLRRWPEYKVDRDNTVLLYTSTVRGPLNLPIEV